MLIIFVELRKFRDIIDRSQSVHITVWKNRNLPKSLNCHLMVFIIWDLFARRYKRFFFVLFCQLFSSVSTVPMIFLVNTKKLLCLGFIDAFLTLLICSLFKRTRWFFDVNNCCYFLFALFMAVLIRPLSDIFYITMWMELEAIFEFKHQIFLSTC